MLFVVTKWILFSARDRTRTLNKQPTRFAVKRVGQIKGENDGGKGRKNNLPALRVSVSNIRSKVNSMPTMPP